MANNDKAAVDLIDLDVWMLPSQAREFAAWLDRSGYHSVGKSTARHLDERTRGDPVTIEIHTSLDRFAVTSSDSCRYACNRLNGTEYLHRLDPPEHLWHLLIHVTSDHPERRGNIRDLLLIRNAIGECSADELEVVRRRIADHPLRSTLASTLSAAQGIHDAGSKEDPFEQAAALRYAVRGLLLPLPIPRAIEGYVYGWAFALLFGRTECLNMWRDIWTASLDRSSHAHVAWFEHLAPSLARVYRSCLRLARTAVALLFAVPTVLLASSVARHAQGSLRRD